MTELLLETAVAQSKAIERSAKLEPSLAVASQPPALDSAPSPTPPPRHDAPAVVPAVRVAAAPVASKLVTPAVGSPLGNCTEENDDDDDDDDDMDSMDEIDAHMRDAEDEMMYIRKGVLDTVVIQQQKRIAELERKLVRSKQEVARLKSVGKNRRAAASAQPGTVSLGSGGPIVTLPPRQVGDLGTQGTDLSTVTAESIGVARQSQTILKRPAARKPTHSVSAVLASGAEAAERAVVHEGQTRYWTADEHERFLRGVDKFGPRNYTAISTFVKSRTPKQVRTHAQKYEMRLAREAVRQSSAPSSSGAHLTPKLEQIHAKPASQKTLVAPALPKVEVTIATGKPGPLDEDETQMLDVAAPQPFVESEIDLLSAGRPVLNDGLDEDAAIVVADRSALHSFDRSFSKSDLKSLGNDEDQWLDI